MGLLLRAKNPVSKTRFFETVLLCAFFFFVGRLASVSRERFPISSWFSSRSAASGGTEYGFRLTRKVSAWGGSLREFCEENGRRELLRQWATEKNGGKTPDGVFCGSSAMTWWRCDKGHSFSMRAAFHTTREQSCPYCARCKVLMGDNDLATVAPDVAAE